MSDIKRNPAGADGGRKRNAAEASPGAKKTGGKAAPRAGTAAGKTGAAPASSKKTTAGTAKKPAAKRPAESSGGGAAKKAAPGNGGGAAKKAAPGNGGNAGAARAKRPAENGSEHKNGSAKKMSAAERTARQREASRERLGDRSLRNSPGAVKLEQERAKRLYKKNETFYKVIYFIAMALVVICGAFLLSFSVLFHIKTINVSIGEGVPYTEEQILSASGIETGSNLLSVSTRKAAENIAYELPYIGNVSVERELPSTVNIKTEEAEVLGLALNSSRQLIVLSTEGKTLEVLHGNNPTGTPIINGMTIKSAEVGMKAEIEKPEQFGLASQVIENFRKFDIELDSITFSSGGSTMTAVYDRRLTIKLGSANGLEEKAELASTLIRQGKILPTEQGTLDMTIHGRAIFRPDYVTDNSGELEYVYEDKGEPDEQYQAELAGSQNDAVME